jgi:hypothetical protein
LTLGLVSRTGSVSLVIMGIVFFVWNRRKVIHTSCRFHISSINLVYECLHARF